MGLNNREWALLVLLAGFAAWALWRNPELRSSLRDLARAGLEAAIIVPVLLMVAYVCGLVFVGRRLGLWNPNLIKPL
jgi:small-conductance mechanosensitive channel